MSIVSPPLDDSLLKSRAYCEQLTRAAAKNFYYGLKLLPEPKRSAMFALYCYMRIVDDIADEEDGRPYRQRVDELDAWRDQTRAVLAGRAPRARSFAPLAPTAIASRANSGLVGRDAVSGTPPAP